MPFFLIHAALMAFGFLFILAALFVAMTQRRKRWWLKLHKTVGLTGVLLLLLGAVAAVAAVAATPEGIHLRTPHTWLGALTILMVIVTPSLGLLQFRIPEKTGLLRVAHRYSGRFLNLIAFINILLGLRVAEII